MDHELKNLGRGNYMTCSQIADYNSYNLRILTLLHSSNLSSNAFILRVTMTVFNIVVALRSKFVVKQLLVKVATTSTICKTSKTYTKSTTIK